MCASACLSTRTRGICTCYAPPRTVWGARGWCLCLLMCNSRQSVTHAVRAINRSNSSSRCMLCLQRLWGQFHFTSRPLTSDSKHCVVIFVVLCHFLLQRWTMTVLSKHIQARRLSFSFWRTVILIIFMLWCFWEILPLIFNNNLVLCTWVIQLSLPNSRVPHRAVRVSLCVKGSFADSQISHNGVDGLCFRF